MHQFNDATGLHWTLRIDTQELLEMESATLLAPAAGSKKEWLPDVLWILCRPRAIHRGIFEREFRQELDGGALQRALEAINLAFSPGADGKLTNLMLTRLGEYTSRAA